jgi:hypothetical protein
MTGTMQGKVIPTLAPEIYHLDHNADKLCRIQCYNANSNQYDFSSINIQ